jgi:hypothetical protein
LKKASKEIIEPNLIEEKVKTDENGEFGAV